MATATYCSNCGNQYDAGAAYCSSCGNARFSSSAVDQSNNHGGTNLNVGGDAHFGDQDRWDTRTKMLIDRKGGRPVWPADWVSIASGVVTMASFLGIGVLPDLAIPFIVVGCAFGAVALVTFMAGNDLRTHGTHVLPFGRRALERAEDGSTWLTEPIAECPFCPEHRHGTMRVERTPAGPQWVCSNSPNHSCGFDGTQMPPILEGEAA